MEDWNREAKAAREDERALETLIEKSRQFILFQAFKAVHHFVSTSDDEWSIALIAFSEAVRTWDEEKGPFKPFAALVIRRRLVDHLQSESRHAAEVSVEPYALNGDYEEDDGTVNAKVRQTTYEFAGYADEASTPGTSATADEIEAVQQILKPYGFSFFDLAACSPKAEKTKSSCARAVAGIIRSEELTDIMRKDRALPMKKLAESTGIERKLLERHRRYIIAAVEIITGDFPVLASYMKNITDLMQETDKEDQDSGEGIQETVTA
ncbi:MAG: RNA polymerase subunit sigma [Lachnospiraceae bacterium]|nr:RNA polymerase subunit sigma [Lachnospiraceae bacterium]